jgi:hypothetical protein
MTLEAAGVELDHVIFFCGCGAPEADALLARGLHEGPGNSHPGQGTVNRRFFFRNSYLELLWVENFTEAQSAEAQRTQLYDRWVNRERGACPFGLVFRPGPRSAAPPFSAWSYVPKYFPPGFSIDVATGIPANEPLLFYLPFARASLVEDVAPLPGGAQIGAITGVTVHLRDTGSLSPALQSLVVSGSVVVEPGQDSWVDLEYVMGAKEIIDLRPKLPLRFLPANPSARPAH